MKKTLSLLLSLIMVVGIITSVPVCVSAGNYDLEYVLNADGKSYSVDECGKYVSDEVVIPDTYNGLPVTKIDMFAFDECNNITTIIIPDTITEIGYGAFSFCEGLVSVFMPNYIEEVGEHIFSDCISLKEITIPDSVNKICNGAFSGCTSLEYIVIPDGVKIIDEWAFDECTSLKSIEIPYGVESIGTWAFAECTSLESVSLPDSLETIGDSAFYACSSLESVCIPKNVTWIDNDAFSDCIALKSVVIPGKVDYLGEDIFFGCEALTEATFEKGADSISDGMFWGCENIKTLNIPASITYIGDDAFASSENIATINYGGSRSSWAKIYIRPGNETLNKAVLNCALLDPPAAPKLTSVSRTASGVKVSWGKVSSADSYIVYRKTAKSGWTNLGTTTENTFTDTKVKTGTTYYYTVKAKNEAGAGGYNKTGLKIKYVAAPKLTKIGNESSGVRVYWSKVSGADGYYLYRRVAGTSKWTKVATIKKGSTTSYLDKKASAGKTYEYIIKCYDGSTPSASAAKTIKIKRLTVPKLVSAKSGKSGITFKWGKVAGAEGYLVYRKTGKGSWVQLTKVEGNAKVSFVDKSAKKGKTYSYTVRAYSGSYKSAYNTKGLSVKDKY